MTPLALPLPLDLRLTPLHSGPVLTPLLPEHIRNFPNGGPEPNRLDDVRHELRATLVLASVAGGVKSCGALLEGVECALDGPLIARAAQRLDAGDLLCLEA